MQVDVGGINVRNDVRFFLQINRIAHFVSRGHGVAWRQVRRPDYLFPFLAGDGNVSLMGGVPAPNGDAIPLQRDGLIGQIGGLRLFQLYLGKNGVSLSDNLPMQPGVKFRHIRVQSNKAHVL